MRRSATVRVCQPVAAPAQAVWDAVMDWPAQHRWMLGTSVEVTAGDGVSVGSQVTAYTGRRPFAVADTMVIAEWDPPRRCVVRHTGKVVRGHGTFLVHAHADGTSTLCWSEELQLPLGRLGAVAWPALRPVAALGLRYSLQRFAAQCGARG